ERDLTHDRVEMFPLTREIARKIGLLSADQEHRGGISFVSPGTSTCWDCAASLGVEEGAGGEAGVAIKSLAIAELLERGNRSEPGLSDESARALRADEIDERPGREP